MNYQKAIAYLKNTIEFNDLEYGSVRQVSEVVKFLEQKERADYTMEGANNSLHMIGIAPFAGGLHV